jgi:hypothetical protein
VKVLQVVPRIKAKKKLKTLLNEKERELRGPKTTFVRKRAGRWVHTKYPGWINWDESVGGILLVEVQSKKTDLEWRLLSAFVGYLDRHFADSIESLTIFYRD